MILRKIYRKISFLNKISICPAVIVNYKVELYDPRSGGFMPSSPGIGMHVEVKDPDDKMVLSRVYSAEGDYKIFISDSKMY